jgi:hypothetical protein
LDCQKLRCYPVRLGGGLAVVLYTAVGGNWFRNYLRYDGMMTSSDMELFAKFTEPLIGLEASHVGMGYGSAIFVELGELHIKVRSNGKIGHNPVGNMTLFACEGWRIEGKRRIWCGSWTDKDQWPTFLKSMQGARVASIALVGRLGEIDLCHIKWFAFSDVHDKSGRSRLVFAKSRGRAYADRRGKDQLRSEEYDSEWDVRCCA